MGFCTIAMTFWNNASLSTLHQRFALIYLFFLPAFWVCVWGVKVWGTSLLAAVATGGCPQPQHCWDGGRTHSSGPCGLGLCCR